MVPVIDELNGKWNADHVPWVLWYHEVADYPDEDIQFDYEPQYDLDAGVDTANGTVNWKTEF